jgi:Flagellar basal body-associated protein
VSDISVDPDAPDEAAADEAERELAEPDGLQAPATSEPPSDEESATAALPAETSKADKRRRLKRILASVGVLVAVLGVAAAAGAAIVGARPPAVELAVNTPPSYYALPEVIGTLAAQGNRTHRVRLGVTLEVESANLPQIEAQTAEIVGATQEHLLDLQPGDLMGRAGAEDLRTFIREVVQARTAPGVVRNVLFTTFIVD